MRKLLVLLVTIGFGAAACSSDTTTQSDSSDVRTSDNSAESSIELDDELSTSVPGALAFDADAEPVDQALEGVVDDALDSPSPLLVACGDALEDATAHLDPTAPNYVEDLTLVLDRSSAELDSTCAVLLDPESAGLGEDEVYLFMAGRFPIATLMALAEASELEN